MRSRRAALLSALICSLASTTGCSEDMPTSVLLHVLADSNVQIEDLELSAYTDEGRAFARVGLPNATDQPLKIPSNVVLFPPQPGRLRLLLTSFAAGLATGQAAGEVLAEAAKQVQLTLTLGPGKLVDRDGDGVPDMIDNCPDLPNDEQKPGCAAADLGPDSDVASDGGPDQLPDLLGGDLPSPDLSLPDLPALDLPVPDLPVSDLPVPDLPAPDL